MNAKLIIFCAGLALAAAATLPHIPAVGEADFREAFETEDAFYLPISDDEAEFLRLPRDSSKLPRLSLTHGHGPSLAFIHNDEDLREVLIPTLQHHNGRARRSVEQILETADAYYVPVTSEEAEEMGLPLNIPELGESSDEDAHIEVVSDEEVQLVNPSAVISSSEDASSRSKRQIQVQGGGSPKQGFDIQAEARAKLWESQNRRNSVHGTAQYSQHLGGPYGNSKPNFGGGLTFTHRF